HRLSKAQVSSNFSISTATPHHHRPALSITIFLQQSTLSWCVHWRRNQGPVIHPSRPLQMHTSKQYSHSLIKPNIFLSTRHSCFRQKKQAEVLLALLPCHQVNNCRSQFHLGLTRDRLSIFGGRMLRLFSLQFRFLLFRHHN